jgi:hypothetical protein
LILFPASIVRLTEAAGKNFLDTSFSRRRMGG